MAERHKVNKYQDLKNDLRQTLDLQRCPKETEKPIPIVPKRSSQEQASFTWIGDTQICL